MRILPSGEAASIDAAVQAIEGGELVALPTETVYGLACALSDGALDRLTLAKGRPEGRPITLLVDSIEQVQALADPPKVAERLAARFWPGPLTLVLPLRPGAELPRAVLGSGPDGRPTAGFRLPDHPVPRALAARLGPLPLTSANRSGEPEALEPSEVAQALGEMVAIVLDGGPAIGGVPSTVAHVDRSGGISILREGALPANALQRASLVPARDRRQERLRDVLERARREPFPKDSTSSEQLSQLHAELVLYEGHVVGTASWVLAGGPIEKRWLEPDQSLGSRLEMLAQDASEPVRSEAEQHLHYYKRLDELLQLARELYRE